MEYFVQRLIGPTTWLFTLPHALPRQGGLDRPEVVQAPAIHLFVALGLLRLILGRHAVEIRAVGIDTRRRRLAVPVIDGYLRHGDSLDHFMARRDQRLARRQHAPAPVRGSK